MTEQSAPERIWMDTNRERGVPYVTSGHLAGPPRVEYVRADLLTAALLEAETARRERDEARAEVDRLCGVILRIVEYDNGCRLKDGSYHLRMRPVAEKPCPELCGCVLEAQALIAGDQP